MFFSLDSNTSCNFHTHARNQQTQTVPTFPVHSHKTSPYLKPAR